MRLNAANDSRIRRMKPSRLAASRLSRSTVSHFIVVRSLPVPLFPPKPLCRQTRPSPHPSFSILYVRWRRQQHNSSSIAADKTASADKTVDFLSAASLQLLLLLLRLDGVALQRATNIRQSMPAVSPCQSTDRVTGPLVFFNGLSLVLRAVVVELTDSARKTLVTAMMMMMMLKRTDYN